MVFPPLFADVTTTVHVTDTSTVTAIKEHTVTQTVTHTVMVEATPEPKSGMFLFQNLN